MGNYTNMENVGSTLKSPTGIVLSSIILVLIIILIVVSVSGGETAKPLDLNPTQQGGGDTAGQGDSDTSYNPAYAGQPTVNACLSAIIRDRNPLEYSIPAQDWNSYLDAIFDSNCRDKAIAGYLRTGAGTAADPVLFTEEQKANWSAHWTTSPTHAFPDIIYPAGSSPLLLTSVTDDFAIKELFYIDPSVDSNGAAEHPTVISEFGSFIALLNLDVGPIDDDPVEIETYVVKGLDAEAVTHAGETRVRLANIYGYSTLGVSTQQCATATLNAATVRAAAAVAAGNTDDLLVEGEDSYLWWSAAEVTESVDGSLIWAPFCFKKEGANENIHAFTDDNSVVNNYMFGLYSTCISVALGGQFLPDTTPVAPNYEVEKLLNACYHKCIHQAKSSLSTQRGPGDVDWGTRVALWNNAEVSSIADQFTKTKCSDIS